MRVRDARQTFLGVWLKAALQGGRIDVWGDGSQRRDLLYVDDAVRAFLLAATRDEADGQVFNVGAPGSVTLEELAELLVSLCPGASHALVPFPDDRKAIDIGDYYTAGDKIRDALGWEPSVSLEDGLRRSLAYYAEHGEAYWGAE
jgi:nucleoside-diphosphate-sugar epimerase